MNVIKHNPIGTFIIDINYNIALRATTSISMTGTTRNITDGSKIINTKNTTYDWYQNE